MFFEKKKVLCILIVSKEFETSLSDMLEWVFSRTTNSLSFHKILFLFYTELFPRWSFKIDETSPWVWFLWEIILCRLPWLDMSRAPMMTTRPAFGGANGFLLAVEVDWTFAKKFLFFSLFSLMLTDSSKTLWYIRARGFGWQLENKWSKWRRFTSWNSIFQTLKP